VKLVEDQAKELEMGVPPANLRQDLESDYFLNKHWQQRQKDLKTKSKQEPMK
jgi:hypothetical protein